MCAAAEDDLADADEALEGASAAFCEDAEQYVDAVDRYGRLFTEGETTVGDVTTAADDLAEPRSLRRVQRRGRQLGARRRGGGQRGAGRRQGRTGDGPVLDDGGGDDHHGPPASGSRDRRPGRVGRGRSGRCRRRASTTTRRWSTPSTSLNAAAFALEVGLAPPLRRGGLPDERAGGRSGGAPSSTTPPRCSPTSRWPASTTVRSTASTDRRRSPRSRPSRPTPTCP